MAADRSAKTVENDGDVEAFLASVPDPTRRADAATMLALMTRVTGQPARLWGASIVGFGRYHYAYSSGREGDMAAAGYSPRKAATTIYLMDGVQRHEALLARLGPHTLGQGCLYLKRLDDVDLGVLEAIVSDSYATLTAGTFSDQPS